MRNLAVLVLLLAGCNDRSLGSSGPAGDLSTPTDAADTRDLLGANACDRNFGYCQPGDLVAPMCKVGFTESPALTATGVCGLGICCVPLEH